MPRGGGRGETPERYGRTEQDCTGKSPVHTSNHPARLADSLSMHPCNVRARAESRRVQAYVVELEGTRSVCLWTSLRAEPG